MKHRFTRRWQTVGVGLTSALLVAGCGATPEEGSTAASGGEGEFGLVRVEESPGDPVDGGTLTFADVSEARSLDPTETIATGASGGTPLAAVYDVLMRYDDESEEFVPWLAEDLISSENSQTWTLTLRDGVEFSDGTPLDAQAVVGSIDYYRNNGGSDAALLNDNIETISAEDDSTVVFELNKSWSTFPNMLAQGAGMIVAPAAIEGDEFEPIGAGPFELEKYSPNEELVLSAREDYWKGTPHLDKLRFVVLPDAQSSLESLQTGDVQAGLLMYPDVIETAEADGFPGHKTLLGVHPVLWINQRESHPGADLRVRQAISYAMDAEVYNERVDEGKGLPGREVFGEKSRWHTDVEPEPLNQEKAKQLLDEAKADGYDGNISIVDNSQPRSRNEMMAVKALLEQVGFTVDTETVRSVADKMERVYVENDFDLATGGLNIGEADPFHRFHAGLSSDSLVNLTGYSNPEMDDLLLELQGAESLEDRQAVIAKIEQLWYETIPGVNLASSVHLVAWQENVHGVVPGAEYMMLFGEAWIDE